MNRFLLCILILCGTIGTSCTPFFAPAMYMQGETYMSKPFLPTNDSTKNYAEAVYLNAHLGESITPSPFGNTINYALSGSLQVHQAHSFKYLNLAYGVHTTVGAVRIPPPEPINRTFYYLPEDAGNKSFQAVGGRFEVNIKLSENVFYSSEQLEIRPLGFFVNYSREFGQYWKFRERFARNATPALNYSGSPVMYSWGITTEYCWLYGRNNPKNKGLGFFYKMNYIQSHFPKFTNNSDFDRGGLRTVGEAIERDFASIFVFKLKSFDIVYQMIFSPLPLFGSKAHSLSVSGNLSELRRNHKKRKS